MISRYVVLDREPTERTPGGGVRLPVWWEDVEAFGEVFVAPGNEWRSVTMYDPRFPGDDPDATVTRRPSRRGGR